MKEIIGRGLGLLVTMTRRYGSRTSAGDLVVRMAGL